MEEELRSALTTIPNMSHPDAPVGTTAEDNKVIKRWGEPAKFDFPLSADVGKEMEAWKSAVTELLNHMNLILREAQDQHLMDTDLLDRIWGPGGGARVRDMMTAWEKARSALYAAAFASLNTQGIWAGNSECSR